MDAISEARLNEVHPELARRVRLLASKCEANGVTIRVTCGERTWGEQQALYNQGRSTPGEIVTKAQGGYSAHNFGYSVDIVPGEPGFPVFTPDWDSMSPRWKFILQMATACGLAEGATWRTFKDVPHLYLQELPADPSDEMRYLFREGGMDAVWDCFRTDYAVPEPEKT